MRWIALPGLLAASLSVKAFRAADAGPAPMPRIVVAGGGRHALLVDGRSFTILGAQAHNSSAWPSKLPKGKPAMDYRA